jgi:hypothetical protein
VDHDLLRALIAEAAATATAMSTALVRFRQARSVEDRRRLLAHTRAMIDRAEGAQEALFDTADRLLAGHFEGIAEVARARADIRSARVISRFDHSEERRLLAEVDAVFLGYRGLIGRA